MLPVRGAWPSLRRILSAHFGAYARACPAKAKPLLRAAAAKVLAERLLTE
jgi:hypothetical protein